MHEKILSGRCILVVEDDYFIATETSQALKDLGATVLGPVPSVKAALDILKEGLPDAAILDVDLVGDTSFPIADALTASKVPFIFLSGYDKTVIPTSHAAVIWLAKPAQMSNILREIGRMFGAVTSPT